MKFVFLTKDCLRFLPGAVLLLFSMEVFGQGTFLYQRYYTPNPDPNFPWDYEGQRVLQLDAVSMTVDLNQDGTPDFWIGTGGAQSTTGFYIYGLSDSNKVLSLRPFDSVWALALVNGETIGENNSGGRYWNGPNYLGNIPLGSVFTASVNIGSLGFYTGLDSAYCGLQMRVNGQTHYGWVRVGAPFDGINGGWVYDAVFNSVPGQSLLAGDGRVPEPTSFALIGVGMVMLLTQPRRKSL